MPHQRPRGDLTVYREISEHLVDIHGQGDHLSLFRVKEHVTFLDRYGGLLDLRRQMADTVKKLREARRQLQRLQQDERETARRVDFLNYQVEEIVRRGCRPARRTRSGPSAIGSPMPSG